MVSEKCHLRFCCKICKICHILKYHKLHTGISKELACLECKKSWESPVQLIKQYAGADDVRSPVEQNPEIRSPVTDKSTEQTPIAPGTPVTQSKPSRSYEAREVAGADILEPTTSFENTEKSPSSEEALQFDAVFHMVLLFFNLFYVPPLNIYMM